MKKDYIKEFRNNFKIAKTADLQHVAVAVNSIYAAQSIGMKYLMDFDSLDGHAGLRVHTFINLASRIFEHAQAMLVALATGSPASSEALGRIVVEGSINLMYLTVLGDASTIVGFFQAWVDAHEKKLQDFINRKKAAAIFQNYKKGDNSQASLVWRLAVLGEWVGKL